MFQTKVVEKIKINILCSITFFRISCHLWDNVKKILYSWTCRKLQYGLYALHVLYLSLQTHIQNMWHLLLSHCSNSCTNSALQCYATGTLAIWFTLCWRSQKSVYCYQSSCHNYSHLIVVFNPLNPKLNPICCLLALLEANNFLHVSRIKVKSLTLRVLMSYIYGAPILDVYRSHTTTHHSR